ncbi:hypothetical protein HK096_004639 [Nowakowskiella sp. JEL0078]|nr:hypothetical protein HK096_004639 [Nowakowskiella sp. JEL0078]
MFGNDLLFHLVDFLKQKDVATLSRSSRAIHVSLLPFMYRSVCIASERASEAFLSHFPRQYDAFVTHAAASFIPEKVSISAKIIVRFLNMPNLASLTIQTPASFFPKPEQLVGVLLAAASHLKTVTLLMQRNFGYFLTVQDAVKSTGINVYFSSSGQPIANFCTIPDLFVSQLHSQSLPITRVLSSIPPSKQLNFVVSSFTVTHESCTYLLDLAAASNRFTGLHLLAFAGTDPRAVVLRNFVEHPTASRNIRRVLLRFASGGMGGEAERRHAEQIEWLVVKVISKLKSLETIELVHTDNGTRDLVHLFGIIDREGLGDRFDTLEYHWNPGDSKWEAFQKIPMCVKVMRVLVASGCGFGAARELVRKVNKSGCLELIEFVRGPKTCCLVDTEIEQIRKASMLDVRFIQNYSV